MKKILFFISFLFSLTFSLAQNPQGGARGNGKISGVVKDSTSQQAVEFATVTLTDPVTKKVIDGSMCDEKGKFSIANLPNGHFTATITFLGYTSKIINVAISDKKTDINLGTVVIGQAAKVLKEVVVEGQKALVEEKVDRTVYNAENDLTTKGGDATDVLKRVPMLSVDLDGNVSLRGSQNIKVLINNKPSTLTASSISDALKQIPSDQIKTVEVITSPSAKYDAEGSAGIINIILKKNTAKGFTLNIDGSSGYRGSNLGLNGSYRTGKMGFSLGGFGRAQYNIPGSFDNTQTTSPGTPFALINIQNAKTLTQGLGGNYTLGWDYDVDKNNSLTASVRVAARNNYGYQKNLVTQTIQADTVIPNNTRNVTTTGLSETIDMNINYTHTFAKPQRELSVLAMYSRNNLTNDFTSAQLETHHNIDSLRLKNVNTGINEEATLQVDYQTPISDKQLIETGVKRIMRTVSSNYQYYSALGYDGPYSVLNSKSQVANNFNYNQNISAGYLSYTLSLPKGYSLKAGARYEYTTINAKFVTPQSDTAKVSESNTSTNIPAYGVLVPSVNFSRKLKNGNVLKAAYNRRIMRPSIQYLNPNLQYSNNLSVTQGKSDLGPEYTDNYELAYSTYIGGSSLNFSGFMRNTNHAIQALREIYGSAKSDTILTTYQNIGRVNAYGLSIFSSVNLSNKFTLNGGGDIFYTTLRNNDPIPQYNASNQGWVYNVRMFGNYKLDKGWGLQFFAFYRGRQVQLQGVQGGFGIYSLSIRKDLPNKKGSIGIGADNFFTPSIKVPLTVNSPLVDSHSLTIYHNLNFKISFSYRIGKMTYDAPRKKRKTITDDDLIEGGDNSPTSASPQQGAPQGGGSQGITPAVAPSQGGQGNRANPATGPGQGNWQKYRPSKPDSTKQNPAKPDSAKQNMMKPDSIKQNPVKSDSLKQNPMKPDSLKQNSMKSDSLKQKLARPDSLNQIKPPKKDNY